MTKSREEVLKTLHENKEYIKRFGVRKLGLFGSAARGETTAKSDLDFLVEFEKNSFDAYMDLKFHLEELFGCKVDLVLRDALKERLRKPILQETIHVPGL